MLLAYGCMRKSGCVSTVAVVRQVRAAKASCAADVLINRSAFLRISVKGAVMDE